jgi:hypothetical protein
VLRDEGSMVVRLQEPGDDCPVFASIRKGDGDTVGEEVCRGRFQGLGARF